MKNILTSPFRITEGVKLYIALIALFHLNSMFAIESILREGLDMPGVTINHTQIPFVGGVLAFVWLWILEEIMIRFSLIQITSRTGLLVKNCAVVLKKTILYFGLSLGLIGILIELLVVMDYAYILAYGHDVLGYGGFALGVLQIYLRVGLFVVLIIAEIIAILHTLATGRIYGNEINPVPNQTLDQQHDIVLKTPSRYFWLSVTYFLLFAVVFLHSLSIVHIPFFTIILNTITPSYFFLGFPYFSLLSLLLLVPAFFYQRKYKKAIGLASLRNFVRTQEQAGASHEQIFKMLVDNNSGWTRSEFDAVTRN